MTWETDQEQAQHVLELEIVERILKYVRKFKIIKHF
jgi:hypothetical protein